MTSRFVRYITSDMSEYTFVINGVLVLSLVVNDDRTLTFHFEDDSITFDRIAIFHAFYSEPHYIIAATDGTDHRFMAFRNASTDCVAKLTEQLYDFD